MPRYPFSPELLDALPEELAELFRGLEIRLLKEICSRLKIDGNLNEVTVQMIRALRSHNIRLDDIEKAIAETVAIGQENLDALFDGVVERNQRYYSRMIDLAGVTAPERLIEERDIAAIRRQTWGAYRNITGSMGFLAVQNGRLRMLEPAQSYHWALDSALLQVQSGSVSYEQAIAGAVRQLAESGLCVAYDKDGNVLENRVAYESGRISHLDVAVRRAVMTGVNQLNQKYREQSMDYLETDLVEVTAHLGARNIDGPNGWENHAAWQGKVYRWRGHGAGQKQTPNPNRPASSSGTDVTDEYLQSATPGQGEITYDDGYEKGKHRDEIKTAQWLRQKFGGDIKLLQESTEKSAKRPDSVWRGRLWEFKHTQSINGADKRLEYAFKQIKDNPGGVVLDMTESVSLERLERQLLSRFMRSKIDGFDLVLLEKGQFIKIIRYKK